MRNPFRSPEMRKAFDSAVAWHTNKSSVIFHKPGVRNTLNSFGAGFWRGYDGVRTNWDAASKKSVAYAIYRAGQAVAEESKYGGLSALLL